MSKNKAAIITQCRISSTRLPNKLLLKIKNFKIIDFFLKRIKKIKVDLIICAVANEKNNKNLLKTIKKNNVKIFLGSKKNVLERTYLAAKKYEIKTVVRITSDCPLIDPNLVNKGLKIFKKKKLNYLSNNSPRTWPHGLDFEIFDIKLLKLAYLNGKLPNEKEHVTPYFKKIKKIKKFNLRNKIVLDRYYRWTLDTKDDLKFFRKLINKYPQISKKYNWLNLYKYLKKYPKIQSLNTSDL
jgi:spore coat polysaccharide biosynthesis protein SpsF